MAKQVINVGTAANDGTGDPLRTAMQKTMDNFDELYAGQFSGAYADLTGIPNANTSVDLHLNTASATNNQILSWDGSDYDWVDPASGTGGGLSNTEIISLVTGSDLDMSGNKVLFANMYDELGDLPSASTYHGMFAHVHGEGKAYYAHNGAWVRLADYSEVSSGTTPSRTTKAGTASSLANNGTANLTIDGFKGYGLYSIQTSHAAWVRLYINTSSRTADASRTEDTDPAADAGVVAEVITTGAGTVNFSPAIIGYNTAADTSCQLAVTNKSGSTNNIVVTLTLLQLEA